MVTAMVMEMDAGTTGMTTNLLVLFKEGLLSVIQEGGFLFQTLFNIKSNSS